MNAMPNSIQKSEVSIQNGRKLPQPMACRRQQPGHSRSSDPKRKTGGRREKAVGILVFYRIMEDFYRLATGSYRIGSGFCRIIYRILPDKWRGQPALTPYYRFLPLNVFCATKRSLDSLWGGKWKAAADLRWEKLRIVSRKFAKFHESSHRSGP